MKILIASDLHWPTINGVATFSRNLAKGLADRGHEVIVIAPSQNGKAHVEKDGNHTVYRTASVPFPFYQNFRISITPGREVKKILAEFKPEVIHIQMLLGIGQAVMKYGNKIGIPIVSTNHAMPENLMDNLKLLAPLARPINYMLEVYGTRFHAKADYITLPTQSAIDMFNVTDRVSVPMSAVSNGIDLSRFKPGHAHHKTYDKFKIPRDHQIITYIGRVDAEKHLYVLIEAFKGIRESGNQAHLLIVGDGTDRQNLENLADKYDLREFITFTGRVTDEDLVDLHHVGTLYAMPSPAELQSIATLEALASGKPVVAVDAGALGELCQNGINGFLIKKDDDKAMADSILTILNDTELRERFIHNSLEIANHHNINTTLEKFEKIYDSLIHKA
jgi:glycosyltransferase involved in cell wall biosynthesis